MKIQLISLDNIDLIKTNLASWLDYFKEDSSDSLEEAMGEKLFQDASFPEIDDFSLTVDETKSASNEFENVKQIYGHLKFLSNSQASDERLWAGLCLKPFWGYVKTRWDIDKKCTESSIKQHFFFAYGVRRSLMRNALARLWWIGRLTYDEKQLDPWVFTKFICESPDYIMHILERNTSNSLEIMRPFLNAILDARKAGLKIDTNVVGYLAKYLNFLGGTYILDCLPEETIYKKTYERIQYVDKLFKGEAAAKASKAESTSNKIKESASQDSTRGNPFTAILDILFGRNKAKKKGPGKK